VLSSEHNLREGSDGVDAGFEPSIPESLIIKIKTIARTSLTVVNLATGEKVSK
jgi:hypothetical protein